MKKRFGIYAVLDKHRDLTKRMNEDARYNLTSGLNEADDEMPDEQAPEEDPMALDGPPLDPQDTEGEDDLDALDLDAEQPADDLGTDLGGDLPADDLDTDLPVDELGGDLGSEPTDMGGTEPTEEIDVTDFIEKGTQLTDKVDGQVKAMADQISNLTQKLSSMDQLLGKIQQVEDEIQSMRPQKPIETLRLRSLDSYPYNQGIDDYWKKKEVEIDTLRDFNRVDNSNNEYVLTNDDVNNYSDISVKDSLRPNTTQSENPFPSPKTNQQTPSRFNNQRQ